jgi:hypothetical protein
MRRQMASVHALPTQEAALHEQLKAFYSDIGRPSVDPELMIRMLLVGYAMAFVMSAGCAKTWPCTLLTA